MSYILTFYAMTMSVQVFSFSFSGLKSVLGSRLKIKASNLNEVKKWTIRMFSKDMNTNTF